jgi:uncharacterized protein YegJ (DUF2314 family)
VNAKALKQTGHREKSVRATLIATAFLSAFGAFTACAQTVLERAQRDELFQIPDEDPAIVAAVRKARATLKDFLAVASKPGPAMRGFAVKVVVRDGKAAEYFWISPFQQKDARFTGNVNNTPRSVRNVTSGQSIEFTEGEILDWLYMDNGRMKGNFTACALIRNQPKDQQEEFKKRLGLDCDA